jgi:signal peptidase I
MALAIGWAVFLRPTALGGPATYVVVSGTSMEPTLHSGDLVVLRAVDHYDTGDVVTYHVPVGSPGAGDLVIHRITGGDADTGFTTRGDNRDRADDWTPTATEIGGRSWFMVPAAGRWLAHLANPALLAAVLGGLTAALVVFRQPTGRSDDDR